jgi:hypothetical protein
MKSKFFTSIAFGLILATSLVAPRANAQEVVLTPDADALLGTLNATADEEAGADTKTAITTGEMLTVAHNTLDAIGSGITAFGNQAFQANDSLPDARGSLNLMGSSGAASDIARTAQKDASSLAQSFMSKVNPFAKTNMGNDLDAAASSVGANEDVYAQAKAHTAKLEQLRLQIATATTVKDTMDLNARINLETADITNEMVKVQALENMEEHNDKLREMQTKQKMFGRNSKSY